MKPITIGAIALVFLMPHPSFALFKQRRVIRDLGIVTLRASPSTVKCYVDDTWEQGQIEFNSNTILKDTNVPHQDWSRSLEGEGFCDELIKPLLLELSDSKFAAHVEVRTEFTAVYHEDYPGVKCNFSVRETAIATHPVLGVYESSRELVRVALTHETCDRAFSEWVPKVEGNQ